jgi:hypothetical protein
MRVRPAALVVLASFLSWAAAAAEVPTPARETPAQTSLSPAATGLIAGKVVASDSGRPVRFALVTLASTEQALRWVMRSGERTLEPTESGQTDERGRYRIGLLPAGEYVVRATPSNGAIPEGSTASDGRDGPARRADAAPPAAKAGFAPIFFPGTPVIANAGSIALAVDEERIGVDFQLPLVPLTRITGVVTGPDGRPVAGVSVSLTDSALFGGTTMGTVTDADGRFVLGDVAPGQYAISARTGQQQMFAIRGGIVGGIVDVAVDRFFVVRTDSPKPPSADDTANASVPKLWAEAEVAVTGAAPADVSLVLQPGRTVTGRLAFEGASAPPPLDGVRVSLVSADRDADGDREVDKNGQFTVSDLIPGRYQVRVRGAAAPWTLATAVLAGRDTLDVLLDVPTDRDVSGLALTMHDRTTGLSGTLATIADRPVPVHTIVVFSSDEQYWTPRSRRIQATRPASDGMFAFTDLPPGRYHLAAVGDAEPGQWFDPSFLKQLIGGSVPITLGDGEKKVQDLQIR